MLTQVLEILRSYGQKFYSKSNILIILVESLICRGSKTQLKYIKTEKSLSYSDKISETKNGSTSYWLKKVWPKQIF